MKLVGSREDGMRVVEMDLGGSEGWFGEECGRDGYESCVVKGDEEAADVVDGGGGRGCGEKEGEEVVVVVIKREEDWE